MAITITGGPAYGLSWDKTADTYTRSGACSALTQPADAAAITAFDGYAPYQLKRCNLWDDGTVTAVYGDRCYTDTEVDNMGQCMVRIPKFYYYSEYDAGTTAYYWFITTDATCTIDVGLGVGAQAVKLHPAFSRDGATRSYIYLGAYEAYFNTTSSKLESKAGLQPTSDKTIAQMRTAAQLRTGVANKWEIQDYLTTCAVQLLYLIEYGTFQSQGAPPAGTGAGITNMTDDGAHNMSSKTGHTIALGNASGQVSHTFDHVPDAGDLTGYAMSYRGIENLYGNIASWIDGININSDATIWVADHDFVSDTFAHPYTTTGLSHINNADGWGINILYAPAMDYAFIPSTLGGSATTKLCDYYGGNFAGDKIAMFGGYWPNTTYAGIFYWFLKRLSGNTYRYAGSRLMYVG